MATEKILGLVTDVIKHSDRHNIVTLFAREQGRVALLSPAGKGKSSRLRNAALVPLSVISADVNFKGALELSFLGNFTREIAWKDLYFNPVKSAIGLFVAEFVNVYTRNSPPDPAMWDYIIKAVRVLDGSKRGFANFHLAFLADFLTYAGIRPDLSGIRDDAWFDMREGSMTIMPPAHRDVLAPAQIPLLRLLARMNLRTSPLFRFSAADRRSLLQWLLQYYSLHFPGLSNLKSPEVLSEVFS